MATRPPPSPTAPTACGSRRRDPDVPRDVRPASAAPTAPVPPARPSGPSGAAAAPAPYTVAVCAGVQPLNLEEVAMQYAQVVLAALRARTYGPDVHPPVGPAPESSLRTGRSLAVAAAEVVG